MTLDHHELTDDEMEFLLSSKAMKVERSRAVEERKRKSMDPKPRLPVKTMITVLVLGVIAVVGLVVLTSSVTPYSDQLSSLNDIASSGALGDGGEQVLQRTKSLQGVYDFRNTGIIISVSITLVLELVLYLQWAIRMDSWEKRRKARRRHKRNNEQKQIRG